MALRNIAKLLQQAKTKKNSPADEFLVNFNQATVMVERENARQPSKSYKPSSMGGCKRRLLFEVTGTPIDSNQSVEPDFVGICESGTDRHERIQSTVIEMERLGIDCDWVDVATYLRMYPQPGTKVVQQQGFETKLENEIFNMRFMCDGIIRMGGKYYILEIKTEASFKFQKREAPEDKHVYQAACYSACLGINDVIFLYEMRDTCKKKSYHVEVSNEDRQSKVVDVVCEVDSHIEAGTVPDKTEHKNECSYCPFTHACKKW